MFSVTNVLRRVLTSATFGQANKYTILSADLHDSQQNLSIESSLDM